jgi:hypothetical protein
MGRPVAWMTVEKAIVFEIAPLDQPRMCSRVMPERLQDLRPIDVWKSYEA